MMLLYVALGGAGGSVARYLIGTWLPQRSPGDWPVATFAVNVLGSFLLGLLLRFALGTPSLSTEWRALLTIGFCGGFTTFSTYSYETLALIEHGAWGRALTYAMLSLVLALGATVAGVMMAREWLDVRAG